MKELDEIIYKENELKSLGYTIENNIIEEIHFNCMGHFGNAISFEIFCEDVIPFSGYNNVANVGYIFKAFVELFGLTEDDSLREADIKNVPCRLVIDKGRAIGIGHFMRDKFVLSKDLANICRDKQYGQTKD